MISEAHATLPAKQALKTDGNQKPGQEGLQCRFERICSADANMREAATV